MAENFSAFDYKTQEEVFTVVKYLTTVLSTTGTQLLETISPSHLLTHLHSTSNPAPALPDDLSVRLASGSKHFCALMIDIS
jgi:cohesin loading factor subunit SCC2